MDFRDPPSIDRFDSSENDFTEIWDEIEDLVSAWREACDYEEATALLRFLGDVITTIVERGD